jgi:signal transduction histidine kinase
MAQSMEWYIGSHWILLLSLGLVALLSVFLRLLRRSNRSIEEVRRLNATQADRIAAREAELLSAFEQLKKADQQRLLEGERRRMMRDMHDGLGSQLVQTLNLVRNARGELQAGQVAAMVQQALEELRLMLDSLEPMDGDLPAILGTLRLRVGPSLEAAGIELDWQVEETAPIADLDSRGVMHLFRCVQEILANVVKHSRASRVRVRTSEDVAGHVFLVIEDDGRGAPPAVTSSHGTQLAGRGLNNIRNRAAQIGAAVRFYDAAPGLGVEFRFQAQHQARAGA